MSIIPIVFSTSDYFAPYFAACLMSLQDVANDTDRYEIHVLNRDVSDPNKKILISCLTKNNISLSFIDINPFIEKKNFQTNIHLVIETFFRFYIPQIFKDRYEKILYCDTDIIFRADPAVLLTMPLGNNKLAAARDNMMNGIMNSDPQNRQYLTDELALQNPDDYFQAGIILLNIPAITETEIADVEQMACRKKYYTCDQDILNVYYQGKVTFFGSEWNHQPANKNFLKYIPSMNESHHKEYLAAKENPKIIHYASGYKPWHYPDEVLASVWWSYARKTVFYGEILCRLLNFQNEQKIKNLKKEQQKQLNEATAVNKRNFNEILTTVKRENRLRFVCDHVWHYRVQKWRFWLCKSLSWGKKRDKYRTKYKAVRDLIREARRYKRDIYSDWLGLTGRLLNII